MDAPPEILSADRCRLASRFWSAATICLGLLPLAMVVADRSSPLIVTLAAAAALAAVAVEGRTQSFLNDAAQHLRTPLGLAVLGFLAWAALSVTWSPVRATSLHALGELLLPVAAAFILVLTLPPRMPPWQAGWIFGAAAALACVLIGLELRTGIGVRGALGLRAHAFLFNRPTLTLLVLLAPTVSMAQRLHPAKVALGGALAATALVTGTILLSYSGAAKLGLIIGSATYMTARLSRRLALAVMALGPVVVFALAPVWGDIADRLLPAGLHTHLAATHSRDRVDIWQSFGAAIRERPVFGAGFGTGARFAETSAAARVAPEYRPFLDIGHPHNAAIQVWAELGAVGAALVVLILLLILRSLAHLSPERLAPRLALFAAVFAVSFVGHGAWQGWWVAVIGAAVVWFLFADEWFRVRCSDAGTPVGSKDGPA
jgi:hypothetical protein